MISQDAPYAIAPPSHRLPRDTSVGIVRLQVSDLDRSLEFYTDALGFTVQRSADRATLAASRDEVLVELVELAQGARTRRGDRLGLYHYAILLPDRAALGSFVAHLARTHVRFGASDHGVSEALYLRDPDGHGIEVYSDRPREEWPVRGTVLQMMTAPLDLDALVHAGGNDEWSTIPAGTRIGHIHLHVGDLAMAEAFYHRALGFDVVARMPGALFMSAGGYHHHLGVNTWAAGAAPPSDDEPRLIEWTLSVPSAEDASAAAKSVQDAGYDARRDGADWLLRDPWGTAVRVAAASPAR